MERNEIHGSIPPADAAIDFDPVLGLWLNSNEKTQWIKQFTLTKRDDRLLMRASGTLPPGDWGEAEVTPFLDNIGERGFIAHYPLPAFHTMLAANMNEGLWVVAAFYQFNDNRPNFLGREFYYRG